MKKINFGSFPLIDMDKRDRKCIDKYMIKNFADILQISAFNSTIKKEMNFITPAYLASIGRNNNLNFESDRTGSENYKQTLKNAFKGLGTIYKNISKDPFFKDKVNFPIYIENAMLKKGAVDNSVQNIDSQVEYDFIMLSNSLVDDNIIDETLYDDRITIIMLYLIMQLYPNEAASKLTRNSGSKGHDVRATLAKFIEHSDKHKIDPINYFLEIIKLAGGMIKDNDVKSKRTIKKSGMLGFLNTTKEMSKISKQIEYMFDPVKGIIKDPNFLLNLIDQKTLSDYFDVQGSNSNLNKNDSYVNNPLFREFTQQKVFKYNRILSLLDYMLTFNNSNSIFEDSATSLDLIKLKDEEDVDLTIDREQLLILLEQQYSIFIENLHKCIDKGIKNSKKGIMSDEYKDASRNIAFRERDIKNLNDQIKTEQSELETYQNQRNSLLNQVQLNNDTMRTNPNQANILNQQNQHIINDSIPQIDANINLSRMNITQSETLINQYQTEIEDSRILLNSSNVVYDESAIDTLSLAYKDFYNEMQDYLFKPEMGDEILEIIKITTSNANMRSSISTVEQNITSELDNTKFVNHFVDSAQAELVDILIDEFYRSRAETLPDSDESKRHYDVGSIIERCFKTNFRQYIIIPLVRKLKRFVRKTDTSYMKKDFSNLTFLKKLTSNMDNFRTYILSEEVLTKLYDITIYTESQKYINGLLKQPPSKLSNPKNKSAWVLKRLGLENNPVFIVGSGRVTVQMPDFMSLSTESLYSTIPIQKLKGVCELDWRQDLQKAEYMFKSKYGKPEDQIKIKYKLSVDNNPGTHKWSAIKTDIEQQLNLLEMDKDDKGNLRKESKKKKEKLLKDKTKLEQYVKTLASEQKENNTTLQMTSREGYKPQEVPDFNQIENQEADSNFNSNSNYNIPNFNQQSRLPNQGQPQDQQNKY